MSFTVYYSLFDFVLSRVESRRDGRRPWHARYLRLTQFNSGRGSRISHDRHVLGSRNNYTVMQKCVV